MTGKQDLQMRWQISRSRRRNRRACKKVKQALLKGQWFQLLGELLSVGFSLKQAIRFSMILLPKSCHIADHVDHQMAKGLSFSQAIRPLVKVDIYYQLLLAEEHGALLDTLNSISKFNNLCLHQRKKLHGLLEYPLILLSMLLMIASAMKGWLFPEIQSLSSFQSPGWWPIVKQVLMGVSVVILMWVIKLVVTYCRQSRLAKVESLCGLPVIGRAFREYYAYYLCSNLSLLVGEGVSEQKICNYLKSYQSSSLLYQLAISYELHDCNFIKLVDKYQCLPNELMLLVKSGLTNAELAKRLRVLSHMKFKKLISLTEHWLTVIQPLMLGVIALIVLLLYLSILLPIYHSMQGVIQ